MDNLSSKLNDFKKKITGWTPENGFRSLQINFAPEDIIFGRRIAQSVQKHGCCENPDDVVHDIRVEAEKDDKFAIWFVGQQPDRLQTLCEFLIYRTPPKH
jgi:hypothetical protein